MKATLIEKLVVQGVGFLQGIVLARLLCPEDFGLAAMLGIFLGVGGVLAESGLGTAYVVYGGDTGRILKWNLGAASIIYLILAIAAPWIADWYHQPILRELTWVMGLSIVIYAASVVRIAQLQRAKRFKALSVANAVAALAALVVGIACALGGLGVWAIVMGALVSGVVRLAVVEWGSKKVESENAVEFEALLKYGWKTLVSGLLGSLYFHSFRLVIGKIFDPNIVGLFHRAQHWATLPGNLINDAICRVALPELVVVGSRSRRWFWVNIALLWPGLVILWIWAEEIVGLVLGAQWLECVPYLRIIILGAAFTPISNVMLCKIRASGRMNLLLLTDAIKKPLQIIGLVVGAFFGIKGLCWAVVAGEAIEAVVDGVVGSGSWSK